MQLVKDIELTTTQYQEFKKRFSRTIYGKWGWNLSNANLIDEALHTAFLQIYNLPVSNLQSFQGLWYIRAYRVMIDIKRRRQFEAKLFVPLTPTHDMDGENDDSEIEPPCHDKPYARMELAEAIAALPTQARRLAIYAMNGGSDPQAWFYKNISTRKTSYCDTTALIKAII